jgi:hypothetical protein
MEESVLDPSNEFTVWLIWMSLTAKGGVAWMLGSAVSLFLAGVTWRVVRR